MRLYGNNILTNATITASSENQSRPASNLVSRNKNPYYESMSDSVNIVFDCGSAQSFNYIILQNKDVTNSATITIQANATDVWTSPSVSQVLTWDSDIISYFWSSNQSYQYIRLVISDSGNTEIELYEMYMGLKLAMPSFIRPSHNQPTQFNDTKFRNRTGQTFGFKGVRTKAFRSLDLFNVTKAEKDGIDAYFDAHGSIIPFYLDLYEDDTTEYPITFVNYESDSIEWTKLDQQGDYWQATLNFIENR